MTYVFELRPSRRQTTVTLQVDNIRCKIKQGKKTRRLTSKTYTSPCLGIEDTLSPRAGEVHVLPADLVSFLLDL